MAAGLAILGHAAAGALLLRADQAHVWFLGRLIPWTCAFHDRTGLPCPTCGVTRSLVMSLHGQFARAWSLAPVGPVAVAGAVALALALIVLPLLDGSGAPMGRSAGAVHPPAWSRAVWTCGSAYAGLTVAVWLGGWAMAFHAALRIP